MAANQNCWEALNCDKKELPLKGWRTNYQTVRNGEGKVDFTKSNYIETSSPSNVLTTLHSWNTRSDIKTIVIDTITHMITSDYMSSKDPRSRVWGVYCKIKVIEGRFDTTCFG